MNANEPAYPIQMPTIPPGHFYKGPGNSSGMTKREVFTMAAMQGMLSNKAWPMQSESAIAKGALGYADTTLALLSETEAK